MDHQRPCPPATGTRDARGDPRPDVLVAVASSLTALHMRASIRLTGVPTDRSPAFLHTFIVAGREFSDGWEAFTI
jgi:hypothetical protein